MSSVVFKQYRIGSLIILEESTQGVAWTKLSAVYSWSSILLLLSVLCSIAQLIYFITSESLCTLLFCTLYRRYFWCSCCHPICSQSTYSHSAAHSRIFPFQFVITPALLQAFWITVQDVPTWWMLSTVNIYHWEISKLPPTQCLLMTWFLSYRSQKSNCHLNILRTFCFYFLVIIILDNMFRIFL